MVQIATIGLAASTDVVGVTIGGILGHAICTGAAVIGGRQLSAHIDERMLSILGGLLFIAFGLHAVWEVNRPVIALLFCACEDAYSGLCRHCTCNCCICIWPGRIRGQPSMIHTLFCFAGCAGMSADAGWRLEGTYQHIRLKDTGSAFEHMTNVVWAIAFLLAGIDK